MSNTPIEITQEERQLLSKALSAPIEVIPFEHNGLSRHSFAIGANNKQYFVKRFTGPDDASLKLEKHIAQLLADSRISTELIAQAEYFLIYEFIPHRVLDELNLPLSDKIALTCDLASKLHQVSSKQIQRLDVAKTTLSLLRKCQLSDALHCVIEAMIHQFVPQATQENLVVCHGDLNFANIILPTKRDNAKQGVDVTTHEMSEELLLIDFESCCLAPPAFDVAMCIAINRLDKQMEIDKLAKLFQKNLQEFDKSLYDFDSEMVTRYLALCFLINGLWYFERAMKNNSEKYLLLALTQFQGIDEYFIEEDELTDKMRQEANNLRLTTMREPL